MEKNVTIIGAGLVGSLWAVYLSHNFQQNEVRAFIDFLAEHWQQDIL